MATEQERIQEINFILRGYEKDISKLNNSVYRRVLELIKQGMPIDSAVTKAFAEFSYSSVVTELVLDASMRTMAVRSVIDEGRMRRYWLNKAWPGDNGFKMSQTVANNTKIIKQTITENLEAGNAWVKTAREIRKTGQIKTKLPKYLQDLVKASRKANALSHGTSKEEILKLNKSNAQYKRVVKKALNNINRLALNGAPTTALKKAYSNLVKQAENFNEKNLQKAIDRALRNKAQYLAERVARTEMTRANAVTMQLEIDQDDDIIGWRSVLNTRHVITDICDFYAKADLFGLGPGGFPKRIDVLIPYHPNCFCLIRRVYKSEVNAKYSANRGAKWIKNNPKLVRQMTNSKTFAEINKNPTNFKLLRGFKNLNTKIPRPPKGALIINPTKIEREEFVKSTAIQA